MTAILDGKGLTPGTLAKLARGNAPIELSGQARERNLSARDATLALSAKGVPIYGLNTGVGALKTQALTEKDLESHALRMLRSHAGGAGELVSPELGRAMLVVRTNQLAAGGAGVHPELLDAMLYALNSGAAPRVHALGSVGTGDLTAFAELGLGLLGELTLPGLSPVPKLTLGPRDGLMLMSSNALSIAEAGLATADLQRLCSIAEAIAALSFEAVQANPSVLDVRVHQARPDPGQAETARRLREHLRGYEPSSARLQDAFTFRCIPQVHGPFREALSRLDQTVTVELNAAAENALMTSDAALANGNFHGAVLSLALDAVRNALAQVAVLGATRFSDFLQASITGLTPFLAQNPGPDSGLMALEYTAHAAATQLRLLSQPVTQSATLSSGVENHASFVNLSAAHTTQAIRHWKIVLAIELIAATRIFRMKGASPRAEGSKQVFDLSSHTLPAALNDRPLSEDVARALHLLDQSEWP
jgi:histidine ammonia-lyase